ncbi:MAG: T9SS type A sorting domain-containing protein [Ignavibacteriae bacterium]|nr:T9SS type A sorting domain-containing protein [Ignavibacteriota bacterium]
MKKELTLFLLIFAAFITLQSVNAQEKWKEMLKRPLELLNENSKDYSRAPDDIGNYSPLPYPYTNINVSVDTFPQNEPSVKFSAKYPNRVVAAWRDFRTGVSPAIRRIGYSYSTNGGISWAISSLIPILDPNHPKASDPVVVSDLDGNFYVATVSITNSGNLDLLVYKSTDGGVTFPIYYFVQGGAPNLEDKEWMVCDLNNSSAYKSNLYISWTRFFGGNTPNICVTKSTNGGVNWTTPVQITTTSNVQGSYPCIGPNGELHVVWAYYSGSNININYSKSTNSGTNFITPFSIAQGLNPNIVITSSNVTFPTIACDLSGGPRNGWLYAAFCDARNGDADVFITRSTNGGNNWSTAVRINNDSIGNGKLQCWPCVAVNDSGNIVVLFYDSRNTPYNSAVEAWLAKSTNGGQTFINEKISSEPMATGEPNTDVRFGDYISVDYKGNRVVPVWTDMRAGAYNQEIYSANIDLSIGIKQVSTITPDKFELFQNYPNPFNPSTTIKFSIKESGFTQLKVYDILGKEITTLINKKLNEGTYETQFPNNSTTNNLLTSGIYFYRLTVNDNLISTKSMMLIK